MARRPARRANAAPAVEVHIEQPGPTEFTDPFVRRELARASVWLGLALAIPGVAITMAVRRNGMNDPDGPQEPEPA